MEKSNWKITAKELADNGFTLKEITEQVPVEYSSVAKWAKTNNINVKSGVHKEWHQEAKNLAADHTLKEISQITGQSQTNIQGYLFRYGISAKHVFDKNKRINWQSRAQALSNSYTPTELSKILDVNVENIRYFFKKAGIKAIKKNAKRAKWHEIAAELAPDYTATEMSKMFNVSVSQVRDVLKKAGVTPKKKSRKRQSPSGTVQEIHVNPSYTTKENITQLCQLNLSDRQISDALHVSKQYVSGVRKKLGIPSQRERLVNKLLNEKNNALNDFNTLSAIELEKKYNLSYSTIKKVLGNPKKATVTKRSGIGAKTNRTPDWWYEQAQHYTVYELSDLTGLKVASVRAMLGKLKISAKRAKGIRKGQRSRHKTYFGKTYEELVALGQKHTMSEIVKIINNGSENSIRAAYKRMQIPYQHVTTRGKPINE